MRPRLQRLVAVAAALAGVVAAPLPLAQAAWASETVENFTNPDDNAYDSGAVSSFSLDGITYTITETGPLADNDVTQDPSLQALADENSSDNALFFDEDDTGVISAVTLTMTDGKAFDIASLDIDVFADGTVTFLANGQSTSVSVSGAEEVTQTLELASADPVFADVTSLTIEGGNIEPALGHIVYSELSPPVVTTTGGTTSFTAVDSTTGTPVAVDPGVTVSDGESATLASGTVSISGNFRSGQDVLAFTNTSATLYGNISASYNASTGVLTLTSSGATATLAQWQAALRAVTYLDTAAEPDVPPRTVSFSVNDGVAGSATATKTLDVFSPPIVTTSGGTTNYAAGTAATVVDSGVTVTDPSRGTQASGTITIGAGFHSGDTLSFTNISASLYGNISASYNSGTGVLTLTSSGASATDAQWADALTAVTFATSATAGPRTVSFIVNDGTDNSLPATKTVDVSAAPVVTTSGGSTSFTAGDNTTSTPVAVDPGVTVSDSESAQLASGTVSITGNLHSGQDVLAFSNTSGTTFGDIAAAYNATTGVLTLTSSGATATLAQWQAALRAVTYTDTAITPNNATRTIS
ncbi:MAG: sulfurtransferase, partial [Acidimicrobiales bacterium]